MWLELARRSWLCHDVGLGAHVEKVQEILRVDIRAVVKGKSNVAISLTVIDGLAVRNIANVRSCNILRGRPVGSYVGVTPRAIVDLTGRRGAIEVPNSAPAGFTY